jgi:transcriptional regulator GlxA family with amidase domain
MSRDARPIDVVIAALCASDGQLTEREAADLIFRSQRQFRSIFQENMGTSFRAFRLRVKLGCAQDLLESTAMSICAISEKLRYAARDKFERTFKQHCGMTPAQYRALRRMKRETILAKEPPLGA